MRSTIHISDVRKEIKTVPYFRNPTKAEIKFGYGAIHYRDFDIEDCFDSNGYLKNTIVAKNDGLIYQYH